MNNNNNRVFPIKTETSCLLKWSWSTVFLTFGTTSSCHRTDQVKIPVDNFESFHNLPNKIAARELMLKGEWPQGGCQYCEKIEAAGGMSDRQHQFKSGHEADRTPEELLTDPTATEVVPTILEIYFNNTCNMACLYCGSHFSTKWEEENNRFGQFSQGRVQFGRNHVMNSHYDQMVSDFWKYLTDHERYKKIRYFQILGGEPFFQKEFDDSIDFWETHHNPEIVFNIITNLKVPVKKFRAYMDRFEKMVEAGSLKRLQITGSIDAWGPQEEYVRWGLDLEEWRENFEYCVNKDWIVLCINGCITPLTIKTMPELIEKIVAWNKQRNPWNPISYSFMTATDPKYMNPEMFGPGVFDDDFEKIKAVMPREKPQELSAIEHMEGIQKQIANTPRDVGRINDLKVYLTEIDRRRGTDWKQLFPWLDQDWAS
jgi:hypothetical protein